ncbi:3-phosphoshikimate 1-carboxyvinyltransferase [Fulvivirgaceae bacterium BMA10]|uniref:3-phosphoshikimate 1-carboxyvinyltransferase n=2 Tax=Splendidivirga corallicola TaxID=3051826 RepID=A0ABT8KRI9_9BACT|nr:3-phosphoshikimate 1-carboxyvinyltransferase [Fulvivirgaceae bacterium BMA10]
MQKLLSSQEKILDVLDAGTTMRFLTAYQAINKDERILTGTARMCERPIEILVNSLTEIGANIEYQKDEGYPPILLKAFSDQKKKDIAVRGDISSQYISALLMIAPVLPQGLNITLTGRVMSRPYIEMTRKLMERFGVKTEWVDNVIKISSQSYSSGEYTIESDWSGASYWYSFVALAETAEVKLLGLRKNSWQGDIKIAEIMSSLGVESTFLEDGVILTKTDHKSKVEIDFSNCPDLAQTVCVVCAIKGIRCEMVGLESLRIKETDRIAALQNELAKIDAKLLETEENSKWELIPRDLSKPVNKSITFDTYHDHRMAMALAPVCTQTNIIIDDPSVVNKSYPGFWNDLEKVGIKLEQVL